MQRRTFKVTRGGVTTREKGGRHLFPPIVASPSPNVTRPHLASLLNRKRLDAGESETIRTNGVVACKYGECASSSSCSNDNNGIPICPRASALAGEVSAVFLKSLSPPTRSRLPTCQDYRASLEGTRRPWSPRSGGDSFILRRR